MSFRERRAIPVTVEHLAYEPLFSVWGHDVVLDREELAPSVLTIAPDGCALRRLGVPPGGSRRRLVRSWRWKSAAASSPVGHSIRNHQS